MAPTRLLMLFAVALIGFASIGVAQYGVMPMPQGLSPRYYLGAPPQLEGRQNNACPQSDMHSCLDVNATVCCPNSQYCIVGSDFIASCCAIGSDCGNACDSQHYQCPTTVTVSGSASVSASCCPRSCPSTSAYKCASAFGGGCCSYDSSCGPNNACVSTAATSTHAVVSQIPSGCTTNQISCASSLGGGCCDDGLSCTVLFGTNYCAMSTETAIRTGANGAVSSNQPTGSGGGGLSSGAKAGIGVGVAIVALLIIGALLWFFLVHRRREQQKREASQPAMSQASGSGTNRQSAGRQASDYFGPQAAPGPFTEDHTVSSATSPGVNRGVPATPHGPGDIAVPVEIGSHDHSNATSPGQFEYLKSVGGPDHPVELP